MHRCFLLLSIVLLCLANPPSATAEDGPGPTIEVGGEPRSQADLREMEAAARQALEAASGAPLDDAAAQRAITDALGAESEALLRAAELVERIGGTTQAKTRLAGEIEQAQQELARLQAESAEESAPEQVDQAIVLTLEAEAQQRAVDAKMAADAAEKLAATVDTRKGDLESLPSRRAQLVARGSELQAQLAQTTEDETRPRALLARQLRTNEVRRGIVTLEEAHHTTLLELDTLRRDRARVRAEVERTRQQIAEVTLARARAIYQKQLDEEARRKEAETRRKLDEAELAESPAVKAISLIEGVVLRMETELASDRRQLYELKIVDGEARVLARIAKTRLESSLLLFPRGVSLEPWQREAMDEQLRQLGRDEESYGSFRAKRVPNVLAILARLATERGRLDVFKQRLELAQDRTDVQLEEDHALRLEQDLLYSQSEDARLWLQARLDFIRGQTELPADAVQRLRVQWQQAMTRLKSVVQSRAEELSQTHGVAQELRQAAADIDEALAGRRDHLDTVAFWMRSTPLFTGAYLADLGRDGSGLLERIASAPPYVAALWKQARETEGGTTRIAVALLYVLTAVVLDFLARRRLTRARVLREPFGELDGLGRMQRGLVLVLRAVLLPGLLLVGAVFVYAGAPGEVAASMLVGACLVWTGIGLRGGLTSALLGSAGEEGPAVHMDPRTVLRARRTLSLLLVGSSVFLALGLVLEQMDLPDLTHLMRFLWGLLTVWVGASLLLRRDVLLAFLPPDEGSAFARTSRSLLRVAWPLAVLFGTANLVLDAMGYRTATAFFVRRAIWFGLALVAIGAVHAVLSAWLLRRRVDTDGDDLGEAYDVAVARGGLVNRASSQLLALATVVAVAVAASLIFDVTWQDWRDLGAWSLAGGPAGSGLTLGRLFKAVVILLATIVIAGHARDLVRILLRAQGKFEQGSRYAIRTLLFYTFIAIGTVSALSALGLDMAQFGWFLTAAGVGIGFGLQDIIVNLISGLILFFERPVQVGDVVTVGSIEGDVQKINIRSTVVRTRDGVSIILPNKKFITEDVVNWSHGQKRTRLRLPFSVAYGSDVARVRKVLLQIAGQDERVLKRPGPEVEFESFGESELKFFLMAWLSSPDISLRRRVRSDLNTRVDALFAENGITIPFPQRDIHIKSGPPEALAPRGEPSPDA